MTRYKVTLKDGTKYILDTEHTAPPFSPKDRTWKPRGRNKYVKAKGATYV